MGLPPPLIYVCDILDRADRTMALWSLIFTVEVQNLWGARVFDPTATCHRWYPTDQNFDVGDSPQVKFLTQMYRNLQKMGQGGNPQYQNLNL